MAKHIKNSQFMCKVHDTCHQILIVFMAQLCGQISEAIAHEDIKLKQVLVPKIKFQAVFTAGK